MKPATRERTRTCRRCRCKKLAAEFVTRAGVRKQLCKACRLQWAVKAHRAEQIQTDRDNLPRDPANHPMFLQTVPGRTLLRCECGYQATVLRNTSIDQLSQLHRGAPYG